MTSTAWTKTRRQNPGAAANVSDDVRSQRAEHLAEKDRQRRISEAQARVAAAKAALTAFDRSPLETELKAAAAALREIEAES